jgi:hypothetical protein
LIIVSKRDNTNILIGKTVQLLFLLGFLFSTESSLGDSQKKVSRNKNTTNNDLNNSKTSKFGLLAEIDQSLNMVSHKDGKDFSTLDFGVYPWVSYENLVKIKFGIDGTQNQKDSEKSQINSGFIGLSSFPLLSDHTFQLTPSVTASLPVNKNQIDRQSLQWAGSLGLAVSLNEKYLPKNLSTGVSFGFGKYFYNYSTSTAGDVNTDYSLRQVLYGNYTANKWFSLYAEIQHASIINFESHTNETFNNKEEFVFYFIKNLSILFGHTNGGSILKADGISNNLAVVNENTSIVYFGLRTNL